MKKVFTITVFLITCICLVFDAHNRWKGDNWKSTVNSDGYGYYAYLPCIFSLHTFDYEKIISEEQKLRPEVSYYDAQTCFPFNNGKRTDKFFAGESVLLLPFFVIAYLIALLFGFDLNGYSPPFQIGVSIGALFYLIIGLIFLRKLLKQYQFSESLIILTAIILVLGTNLLYYATMEPSMSHIYCFSLMAVFLYYVKTATTKFQIPDILKASAIFCLLLIVRPTNINALAFVPFIAADFNTLKSFLQNVFRPRVLLAIVAVSIPVILIQFIIWKIETGHFLYWSYQGERFYFASPKFVYFLFSFRNGWFIYTPVMFLIFIAGAFILWKKSFYQYITFLIFFSTVIYILSSWYAWYYGGFGMRAMVDYYAAFAIILAMCLNYFNKNKWLRIIASVILGFLIFVNITQTRQYTNSILSNEYMNRARYWKLFLKTDSKYVGMFEHHPLADITFFDKYSYVNDFENNIWGNNNSITDEYAHIDRHSACVGTNSNYSPVLALKTGDLPVQQNLYTYIFAAIYMPDSLNDAALVLQLQTKDGAVYSITNVPLKPNISYFADWEQFDKTISLSAFKNMDDTLKIYFMATKGKTFIDDERIRFGIKK